jgi:EmrB/QacA subfamily drug resistance transporter
MATLDSSIVNIALPTLTKELGPSLSQVKWVVVVYLLTITSLLLPFGRLSDQFGRKTIFQLGFFTFVLGSGFCGLAPSLTYLVIFRALQAIGAAMLMANGPAIIASTFPSHQRGSALGTLAMVVSLGLLTGPGLGGLLITHFGWRSIFLINLPFGFLGVVLVEYFLKSDRVPKSALPFDWLGTFLQSAILTLFILSFDLPQVLHWKSISLPLIAGGAVLLMICLLAAFIKVESVVRAPLFDLSLLRNRTFWIANLAAFLVFVAFSSVTVLMPFFLEEVLHFAPQKAGIFMTAIPITIFIVAPISGRLSDRLGSLELCLCGNLIGIIGLFSMSGVFGKGIQHNTDQVWIIAGLCAIGMASGLFQSPNNNTIMGSIPVHKLGIASAFLGTVRNLGLVTGTGFSTSMFTWVSGLTGNVETAVHASLFMAGLFCVGALLASLGKIGGKIGACVEIQEISAK